MVAFLFLGLFFSPEVGFGSFPTVSVTKSDALQTRAPTTVESLESYADAACAAGRLNAGQGQILCARCWPANQAKFHILVFVCIILSFGLPFPTFSNFVDCFFALYFLKEIFYK